MNRILLSLATLAVLGLLAGCASVKVDVPEGYGIPGPQPPSTIAQASPGSPSDVIRENQQLRARAAWLEDDNRHLSNKYDKLGREIADIQADTKKYAAQRDAYKREVSR